jgi:hypothetical protein
MCVKKQKILNRSDTKKKQFKTMPKFKSLVYFVLACQIISSCKKTSEKEIIKTPDVKKPTEATKLIYPLNTLDSISAINKTTSWYNTNKSFDQLFNVHASLYWGFEVTGNGLIPYNTRTTNSWSASKSYYWNDLGAYLYTDMTGDGQKDL